MPNKYRGEIEAELGGVKCTLVLTLGALAELESAFGADDLVALTERIGSGRLKALDLIRRLKERGCDVATVVGEGPAVARARRDLERPERPTWRFRTSM